MTTTISGIFICLLLQCIIDLHPAASHPVIDAFPQDIDLGLTDALDVNCTVSTAEWSDVAALISLTISRNTSQTGWKELGIITEYSKGQVNVQTKERLRANGWFKAGGSASINLHWDYPTDQQAGNYICSAEGLDPIGHSVVSTTDVLVSSHSANLPDFEDKLRDIEIQMKNFEQQMKSETQRLELEITELKLEKERRSLEMFEMSIMKYKNHTYYVSRDAFYNIYVSLAVCRIYGGYLAVVDDGDEFNAINNFLKSTSGFDAVYISGTDEGHEGNWTLSSGEELPFSDWGSGQPGNLDNKDCMTLFVSRGTWDMWENVCHHDEPSRIYRFMCEVP